MQANGSEMLRIACCKAIQKGVGICAPVHDAILIEASINELDDAIETAKIAMADASEAVLNGYRLRTNANKVTHPDRYFDERGEKMWEKVQHVLSSILEQK